MYHSLRSSRTRPELDYEMGVSHTVHTVADLGLSTVHTGHSHASTTTPSSALAVPHTTHRPLPPVLMLVHEGHTHEPWA